MCAAQIDDTATGPNKRYDIEQRNADGVGLGVHVA
jgi:hypothetical protein